MMLRRIISGLSQVSNIFVKITNYSTQEYKNVTYAIIFLFFYI